jgi:hypothetical protein
MSNTKLDSAIFLPTGDPATSIETLPGAGGGGPYPRSGELGHVYPDNTGRRWQKVVYAATLTQAAVLNNLVYWTAAHGFTVDTDYTDSEATVNSAAGVIMGTTGNGLSLIGGVLAWVLQEGRTTTVNGIAGVNFLASWNIIASTTAGKVTATAALTAPLSQVIGTVHTPVDNSGGAGPVVIDLDMPSRSY